MSDGELRGIDQAPDIEPDLEGRLFFAVAIARDQFQRAVKEKAGVEEAARTYQRVLEEFSDLVYSRMTSL